MSFLVMLGYLLAYPLAMLPTSCYCRRYTKVKPYRSSTGEYGAALAHFERAWQLDPATHRLAA